MAKSKKRQEQEKRWNDSAQKFIEDAMQGSVDEALLLLGTAIRAAESVAARLEYKAKQFRERLVLVMLTNQTYERRITTRTFLRLDPSFSIPKDEDGAAIVQHLTDVYGRDFVKQVVEQETEEIPARTEVHYKVKKATITDLGLAERFRLVTNLRNAPKLHVDDPPKRVMKGKGRTAYHR